MSKSAAMRSRRGPKLDTGGRIGRDLPIARLYRFGLGTGQAGSLLSRQPVAMGQRSVWGANREVRIVRVCSDQLDGRRHAAAQRGKVRQRRRSELLPRRRGTGGEYRPKLLTHVFSLN